MKGKTEFFSHPDLPIHIFSYCSKAELAVLSRVSKRFQFFASAASIWSYHLKRDFNSEVPTPVDATTAAVHPKRYYQSIKHRLWEEKERALNYYLYRALATLYGNLDMLRDIEDPGFYDRFLRDNEKFELLPSNTIRYLTTDVAFTALSTMVRTVQQNPEPDNALVQGLIEELFSKMDKRVLEHIKSLARPHLDALLQKPLLSKTLSLPICSSVNSFELLYECREMTLLKVSLHQHPEAINQLAKIMGAEIFLLFKLQCAPKDEKVCRNIQESIDLINLMLSYDVALNCQIIGPNDEPTTARKLALQCVAVFTLSKLIDTKIQTDKSLRLKFAAELDAEQKPYTLQAVKELGIAGSFVSVEELNNFMEDGLNWKIRELEENICLDIQPNILSIMNRILDVSLKQLTKAPLTGAITEVEIESTNSMSASSLILSK